MIWSWSVSLYIEAQHWGCRWLRIDACLSHLQCGEPPYPLKIKQRMLDTQMKIFNSKTYVVKPELCCSQKRSKMFQIQFSSVAQPCPTLCDSMDCSNPGFPVHHQLLELAQTRVHWVGDVQITKIVKPRIIYTQWQKVWLVSSMKT